MKLANVIFNLTIGASPVNNFTPRFKSVLNVATERFLNLELCMQAASLSPRVTGLLQDAEVYAVLVISQRLPKAPLFQHWYISKMYQTYTCNSGERVPQLWKAKQIRH